MNKSSNLSYLLIFKIFFHLKLPIKFILLKIIFILGGVQKISHLPRRGPPLPPSASITSCIPALIYLQHIILESFLIAIDLGSCIQGSHIKRRTILMQGQSRTEKLFSLSQVKSSQFIFYATTTNIQFTKDVIHKIKLNRNTPLLS